MQYRDVTKDELLTKSVKTTAEETEHREPNSKTTLDINYEKAEADAINKLKRDLATKEIDRG